MSHTELLNSVQYHQVFRAAIHGNTLVVAPTGDLGSFGVTTSQTELTRIRQLAEMPEVQNLIVDLGGSSYYGSEMIGALFQLRDLVESKGRFALAALSDDMEVILTKMRLSELAEFYPTVEEGLRHLSDENWIVRWLRRHPVRKRTLTVTLLVLLAALGVYLHSVRAFARFVGSPEIRQYDSMRAIYDDLVTFRHENHLSEEWATFAQPQVGWLHSTLKFYVSKGRRSAAQNACYFSARMLLHCLGKSEPPDDETVAMIRDDLASTERVIEQAQGVELESIVDVHLAALPGAKPRMQVAEGVLTTEP